MLRQPIITVLGHVDHGKTSLLDTIRHSTVAGGEAGGITQAIGSTEVPIDVIKRLCGHLADKFRFDFTIPGVLFIDTPGHEAFSTLRKRGGSIADLAVLVVDINEGLMPQTIESINILRDSKVPFVIAVNKIDRIQGWSSKACCFLDNCLNQTDDAKAALEEKFYLVVEQMALHGFAVERFDRINDFTKNIAAVPVSGRTGEGLPDLLTVLAGLAQQFLKERLTTTEQGKGIILEVKEVIGLGMTIDTIIYDGVVQKNYFIVIGGRNPRITKIRAMLVPEPMKDIRVEKKFMNIEECRASRGVKISAPGLDDVIAGSEIRTAKTLEEAELLLEELEEETGHIEISTEGEGLLLKADTLGSLEALISVFRDYPLKEASIGQITKQEIIKAEANTDMFFRIIIGFNTKLTEEIEQFAKERKIKILASDVIYRLKEDYEKWVSEEKEAAKKREIESIARAGKIRILPGCIFRASNPAIVGCEVLGGIVKPGYRLIKDGKEVGEVKQIQSQGQNVDSATISDKIAVSIIGPTVGRQIDESDILYTDLSSDDYKRLIRNEKLLTEHEKKVLEEITETKRKTDKMWGF